MILYVVISLLLLVQCSWQCENTKRIPCLCGTSGTTTIVSVCSTEVDSCKKFQYCLSCSDDLPYCVSCPPGLSGPYCTQNSTNLVEQEQDKLINGTRKRFERSVCPDLPSPKLGSIRCWSSRRERECTGKCLPGHFFPNIESEELLLRCQNGRWYPMSSFPKCVSEGLCELEIKGAGSYNCTTGSFGTRCDVRCTGRTRVQGRFTCYPGQDWEPTLPYCVEPKALGSKFQDCGCENGGTCDQQTGTCRCPSGYTGNRCEGVSYPVKAFCRDPGHISNGERVNGGGSRMGGNNMYEQGSRIAYICADGFNLVGSGRLTCTEQGSWSANTPYCQRTTTTTTTTTTVKPEPRTSTCPDPGFIDNGERWNADGTSARRRRQTFQEGSSLVFSCKNNYALHGLSLVTCTASGQWSRALPQCRRVNDVPQTTTEAPELLAYCDDPGTDPNGDRVHSIWLDPRKLGTSEASEKYPQGSQFDYTCREGYSLQGESTITCLYTGYWSNFRPVCQQTKRSGGISIAYCEDPGYISNGKRKIIYNLNERSRTEFVDEGKVELPEGIKIEYDCEGSLQLFGQNTITCLPTGSWSAELPECRPACGQSGISTTRRIILGNKTVAGEWPWQVAIGVARRNGRVDVICGGALVNLRTVITAAHCIDGVSIQRTTLYFGKYYLDMNKDDERVITRQPTNFVIHPRYNRQVYNNDIAIIRFVPNMKTTNRIQPICLPTPETTRQNLVPGKYGYVVGWGLTEKNVLPETLLMAKLPFVSREKCEKVYREQDLEFPITESMFCAGFDTASSDSCTGDSGGPMSFQDPVTKRFVLEGLVSYGVKGGCGRPKRYTVYTKVGNVMRWVRANT